MPTDSRTVVKIGRFPDMNEAEPAVKLEVTENIATITLNRPENRNSMTPDLLEAQT